MIQKDFILIGRVPATTR